MTLRLASLLGLGLVVLVLIVRSLVESVIVIVALMRLGINTLILLLFHSSTRLGRCRDFVLVLGRFIFGEVEGTKLSINAVDVGIAVTIIRRTRENNR